MHSQGLKHVWIVISLSITSEIGTLFHVGLRFHFYLFVSGGVRGAHFSVCAAKYLVSLLRASPKRKSVSCVTGKLIMRK